MTDTPPGIDPAPLGAWLAAHLPGAQPPFHYELISGGRSNLTYRVTDSAGSTWALRRPPLGHVLATAHDMGREFRIISGLSGSAVPVARPHAFCADEAVNGAPFYVMAFVPGVVVRDVDIGRTLEPRVRRAAALDLIDTLARLHAYEPDEVGLGELGRREGYLARQLRRWMGQFLQSTARELPQVQEIHDELEARLPADPPARIVHGDYRLENTMLSPAGEVAAVLDWELCTLGDPLADLGLLLAYWPEPGEESQLNASSPTVLEGFPRRAELVQRYAAAAGRAVADVSYYEAFASWKLACIGEGVATRYAQGAMADRDAVDVDDLFAGVERRLAWARQRLDQPAAATTEAGDGAR